MKKSNLSIIILTLSAFLLYRCNKPALTIEKLQDNPELVQMVIEDQEMRMSESDDPMAPKDKLHRLRTMELLSQNLVKTPVDKFNAALILQHTELGYCDDKLKSSSPENYYLAFTLAKSSMESGNINAANLVAATYDRFLYFTEGYQKYGTQKIYFDEEDEMLWAPIDTLTTDEERKAYGVKPLSELLKESKVKKAK